MKKNKSPFSGKTSAGIIGNLIIICIVPLAIYFDENAGEIYYRALQEDELFEWATFWAFFAAASVFSVIVFKQISSGFRLSWFFAGVSLFCFFVAMEEISWGQRLFSYRPPEYFLGNNFQQELNIHNVISKDIRILTLKLVIAGYGILLPVLNAIPPAGRLFRKLGIFSPPLALTPAFIVTLISYQIYPVKFTGELVELMLGFGFLFSSFYNINKVFDVHLLRSVPNLVHVVFAALLVFSLGSISTVASNSIKKSDPELVKIAEKESLALLKDVYLIEIGENGFPSPYCGYHVRVYNYLSLLKSRSEIDVGNFDTLVKNSGYVGKRTKYYLDPWNSPYWIRYVCIGDEKRFLAVYSFGPDQKRQSLPTKLLGDDVGSYKLFNYD